MIRKTILFGCVLGAVVYAVAWVVLAFPGANFGWMSEDQRMHVFRLPRHSISVFSLSFGTERLNGRERGGAVSFNRVLLVGVRPDRVSVVLINRAEDPRGVTVRRIGLGSLAWAVEKSIAGPGPSEVTRAIEMPSWFPFVVLAAYPGLVLVRGPVRRWRRRKRGLCLTCGYSLEGNASGVCPECGSEIPQ